MEFGIRSYLLAVILSAFIHSFWIRIWLLAAVDVALGKPVFFSSEIENKTAGFATDGLKGSRFQQNDLTCVETTWEFSHWIIIDLLQVLRIDGFNLTNSVHTVMKFGG